jgi:tetratricopeptide (TPR) repeat protein
MDRATLEARDRGRVALLAGEWEKALDGLGTFIGHAREPGAVTADDYLGYAKARRHVVLPNGTHLVDAIGILRKARQLDPTSRPVQDELLGLYISCGYATEALELMDSMLAGSPSDIELLRTKCDLLDALRQYPKALEVARRIHELQPNDIAGPARTLRLLLLCDSPASDVDLWLAAVTTAHPNDPRFDLLRAAAYARRQDFQKAKEVLDRVVAASESWKDKDPKFLALLLDELDAAGRYDDALAVAGRVEDAKDPHLQRECVRRLWYAERPADLVTHTERWAAAAATADPEILALRSLALAALDRRPDADAVRRVLAAREDAESKAWSTFLTFAGGEGAQTAGDLEAATRAAPGSGVLLVAYGDAQAALGELDAAVGVWMKASARARAWARPFCRISEVMRRTGRPTLAALAAKEAVARSPRGYEAVSEWLLANADLAMNLDPKRATSLLDVVAKIRKRAPQASMELVPVEAGLLARTDKSAAQDKINAVLNAPEGATEDVLVRLAQIARTSSIPLEARLFDLSEKLHGATPRLAVARALAQARDGGVDAGLRAFDELRGRAGAAGSGIEWGLARARLMDAVGHPAAAAAWIELADANPAVVSPQLGFLSCGASWGDLKAIDRVVERLKTLTGDSGVAWRTARGRRLLDDVAADKSALAEAVTVLNSVVQSAPRNVSARLLLAQAYNRLGNGEAAEEQLRSAIEQSPDDPSPSIELARVAQSRGESDVALHQIDRALASPRLAASDAVGAASLLAGRGDFGRSQRVLQPMTKAGRLDDRGLLLLAGVRASLGDVDGAIQVCEQTLERPSRESLELAAELYAAVGRAADSERALSRLDALGLPPGDADLIRARIAGRWGAPADAKAAFRRAVAAAPGRADVWTESVACAVSNGDAETLGAILDDKALPPGAASPKFVSENRALVLAAIADVRLRRVALAAMADAPERAVLLDAMRIVTDGWSDLAKRDDVGRRLQDLAQSNPRVLVLQLLTAEVNADLGRLRPACDVADRAMRSFPDSPVAAQASADLLSRSGRWTEAIESAKRWKELSGGVDPQPDLFLARAMLQIDRARDAAAVLEPRCTEALASPETDANRQILLTCALAMSRGGRAPKAWEMLDALAKRSDAWRAIPVDVQPEWFGSADNAKIWLEACARNVPSDDATARTGLAKAWGAAWERFRTPDLLAGAKRLLAQITAAPDAPAAAHFVSAVLCEREGDRPGAMKEYEAAIARDPRHVAARNNLAMLLADSGKWEAAVEHGERLVAEFPRVPALIDTLAYALRKGRKFDEARKQMERAVDVDPTNPAWRVGLAEVLSESGDRQAAADVLKRVDAMAAAGVVISSNVRARIDSLRTTPR